MEFKYILGSNFDTNNGAEMISLFGSNVDQDELSGVGDTFQKQWLGIGPKVAEFEGRLKKKTGARDVVFVNSGSNALHLALKLLDLPEGSEVILPSFTWIACANAVVLNRLKPVFCDVDISSCNMRPEDVEKRLTSKTSAIMVVHYAGKPVDMDGFKRFNLPIIEDAAHAIDSYYRGAHCGSIGTVGIFSFDAVKNITTGEGGAVLVQDEAMGIRARKLRYCGVAKSGFEASANKSRWWEYEISDSFPKMINTDIAAAIGLAQLDKLEGFQSRRKLLWELYDRHLSESWATDWIEGLVGPASDEKHSYFSYCIKLKMGSRDRLAKYMYDQGIYTSLRFHPLHLNEIYGEKNVSLKNCEWLNEHALNIPLHHRLSDGEVEKIFSTLRTFRNDL